MSDKPEKKLTPKQEAFCLEYVASGHASNAYRKAYAVKPETTPKSVNEAASHMLMDSKIAARVDELYKDNLAKHTITVEDLIAELHQCRAVGMATGQVAAATGAVMGKAKLMGFLTDKMELTGKGGGPVETVTKIERVIVKGK